METLRSIACAISSVYLFLFLWSSVEGHPHPYVNFDPGNDVFVGEKEFTVTGFSRHSPKGESKAVTETVVWSEGVLVVITIDIEPGVERAMLMEDGKERVYVWMVDSWDDAKCSMERMSDSQIDFYNRENSWLKDVFPDETGNITSLQRRKQPYKALVEWEKAKECARIEEEKEAEEAEAEESDEKRRSRRSIIMPGTTWCGVGNVSASNERVDGNQVETDKCCRRHDMCNHTIGAFSRKYHLFNFRLYTISHCECDDRFRSCLRMAHNEHSNTVGQLFFNFLGIPCFEFERISVCRERNWYGRCLRYGTEAQAVLRDPISYYVEQR